MIISEQVYNCIYGRLVVNSETKRKLKAFCKKHKIQLESGMEFHCTVVYDERPYAFQYFQDYIKTHKLTNPIKQNVNFQSTVIGVDYFGPTKNCLVAKIDCPKVNKLFHVLNKSNRFQYSYNPYIPHVTLQYKGQNIVLYDKTISELKEIPIVFDRFILEQEGEAPTGTLSESLSLEKIFDIKNCFIEMNKI